MSPALLTLIFNKAVSTMASEKSMELKWNYIEAAARSEGLEPEQVCQDAYRYLAESMTSLSCEEVEALMVLASKDIESPKSVSLLNALLLLPNHQKHEDIAQLLQQHHDPSSIQSLETAAQLDFDYLAWDENRALTRKCLWALAAINSNEAWTVIEKLAKSEVPVIQEWANEQLDRPRIS